ncbi:MAG: hypothetical protein ACK55I_23510, partial [bacterium]
MKALQCFAAVPYIIDGNSNEKTVNPSSTVQLQKGLMSGEMLIPLAQVEIASTGKSTLTMKGGRSLLKQGEIRQKYWP